MKAIILILLSLSLIACVADKTSSPNIVIILADDMGYGDVQSFNPNSEVPTPHLNQLAEEGIMFMDAHTPSAICTPTRYGLLTGRYCWRSSLKRGVLKGYSPPLIEEDRVTIASYLKGKGYRTGVVGKWHLGLGFQKNSSGDGKSQNTFDLTKTLNSSPNNNGFDYSYVLPASLDFEPYVYVRNDEVVDTEFDSVPTTRFPHFWREGIKSRSLEFDQVLDDLLLEAKGFIQRESKSGKPFFLYFPLTAPHKPVIPTVKFIGTSGKGLYGDFLVQIDWTAGEIFKLLEALEIEDNTLVIFASDNGSPMRRMNSNTEPDHVTDQTIAYYNASSHQSNSLLRGIKGDTYEGGHRVPFIVRWPAKFSGGRKVKNTICLTDIFETLVDVTGGLKPGGSAEDSYSFYPIISGEKKDVERPPVIHHSGGKGMFAIRKDNWKMILGDGSGARTKPVGVPFQEPFQLYDIDTDITESNNLIDQEIEVAETLKKEFYKIKGHDPLSLHFKKDYQVRNFYNSSVLLSRLDLSQDVESEYPRIDLTSPGCDFKQKRQVLQISNNSGTDQESYINLGKLYNYAAIDLDIQDQSHDSGNAIALFSFYRDKDNRIVIAQRDGDAGNNKITLEIIKNGSSVFNQTLSEDGIQAPNTLRVHLTGKFVNVLVVKDEEWTILGSFDVSEHFELRDLAVLESFTLMAGARLGSGESITISKLEQYLTTGTAQADPKILHYEDGEPIIEGNTIWVAMTTRAYDTQLYQGIYSYDLKTKEWKISATLVFNKGDGLIRQWSASDVFYDRTENTWKIFTVSHRDDHMLYSGETTEDPRFGLVEIACSKVNYASVGNEEDPSVIYDSSAGKWRMAVCKAKKGYQTVLMEADTWNGAWSQIGVYTPTSSTGTLIQKTGGQRYVFIGRGDTPCPMEVLSYPGMEKVGELSLSEHPVGKNVWPAIIPVSSDSGTAYYLLTFDRDAWTGPRTYGNIHWYRAEEFAEEFYEYPALN